jgi:predicted DNA-binding protein with PD1-like motif
MKIILKDNRRLVLRFDKGEDVIQGIIDFMKAEQILACTFSGIGACDSVELGFFNSFLKEFRKKPYVEELEITSFTGNAGTSNGEPAIHAHGVFTRNDFSAFGGHVFKLTVSVTCEVFLIKLDGEMKRENNPDFNLTLLS